MPRNIYEQNLQADFKQANKNQIENSKADFCNAANKCPRRDKCLSAKRMNPGATSNCSSSPSTRNPSTRNPLTRNPLTRNNMNHLTLPSFSQNGHLNAVIEIPAGTNTKYEYDKQKLEFRPDVRDGKPRMIDFLSYPLNYGFIPSTKMDKQRGGDGDPLDVLVLAEHLPVGTVIEVKPIGLLLLKDLGELDNKVLAIPVDPAKRIIRATSWQAFQQDYSAARHLIEIFFMYYDGLGTMTVMGWSDEASALEEVKKWQLV